MALDGCPGWHLGLNEELERGCFFFPFGREHQARVGLTLGPGDLDPGSLLPPKGHSKKQAGCASAKQSYALVDIAAMCSLFWFSNRKWFVIYLYCTSHGCLPTSASAASAGVRSSRERRSLRAHGDVPRDSVAPPRRRGSGSDRSRGRFLGAGERECEGPAVVPVPRALHLLPHRGLSRPEVRDLHRRGRVQRGRRHRRRARRHLRAPRMAVGSNPFLFLSQAQICHVFPLVVRHSLKYILRLLRSRLVISPLSLEVRGGRSQCCSIGKGTNLG